MYDTLYFLSAFSWCMFHHILHVAILSHFSALLDVKLGYSATKMNGIIRVLVSMFGLFVIYSGYFTYNNLPNILGIKHTLRMAISVSAVFISGFQLIHSFFSFSYCLI